MIIPKQNFGNHQAHRPQHGPVRRVATAEDGSETRISCSTGRPTGTPRSSSRATTSPAGRAREHAPWALLDFGIRCVISTSFRRHFDNTVF